MTGMWRELGVARKKSSDWWLAFNPVDVFINNGKNLLMEYLTLSIENNSDHIYEMYESSI